MTGQILRYKIIAKDMKINWILYNTGNGIEEVPFEEIRLNQGDFVIIPKSEISDSPMFG